jgi:fatty acid synthase
MEELNELGLLVTPDRPHPRPLEYADLSRLTYLNCVIKVVHAASLSMSTPSLQASWSLPPCAVAVTMSLCLRHAKDIGRCAAQESLRIRPVLPILFRRAMKDVQLGPYLLPEGTIIELHLLAMNTHPLYWDRPDEFLPVR